MKAKYLLVILCLITAIGVILRFYKISTNIVFGADQAEDMIRLTAMYEDLSAGNFQNLPLIGEPGTYLTNDELPPPYYPVYSGAFFLYLILPLAVLAAFKVPIIVGVIAVLYVLAIPAIYLIGREILDKKAGLAASALFSTSYFMNIYSRAIWTPSLIPPFVVFALLALVLVVKKKRVGLWPLFLFLVSSISQVHDSGYFYLLLFGILAFALKPVWPKGKLLILSILIFLVPLLPTFAYEYQTSFALIPAIIKAFLFQLKAQTGGNLVLDILSQFWRFWASTVDPMHFDSFYKDFFGRFGPPIVWLISIILLLSLLSIFSLKEGLPRRILKIFLLTFLIIPFFTKVYYNDQYSGLASLFGTTFSAIGAMPFVFLSVGAFLSRIFNRGVIFAILSVTFLGFFIALNAYLVSWGIWKNGDQKYDYGDKVKMVSIIHKDTAQNDFDLTFKDPNMYADGIEFLYLISEENLPPPVSYNGFTSYQTFLQNYKFSKGPSKISYLILAREYWGNYDTNSFTFLGESGRYKIFRKKSVLTDFLGK